MMWHSHNTSRLGKMVYNKIKGKYEDVKTPMYLDGLLNEACLLYERGGRIHNISVKEKNDTIYNKDWEYFQNYYKENNIHHHPEEVKLNSVWSFAGHNNINRNDSNTTSNTPPSNLSS